MAVSVTIILVSNFRQVSQFVSFEDENKWVESTASKILN